jgi:Tol biopolymer transport system component
MGEVYRALDSRLGRSVAIKILRPDLAGDPDRLRRFEQEARAAGGLNHPSIVAVHDVGIEEATPYVVSELLEGRSLRAHLASGPLPMGRALGYAVQVAQALAAAHDAHIVHRDLKPGNVFVTREGRVKVLDFGLCKLIGPRSRGPATDSGLEYSTAPGAVLGTPGYMAPEQVRGAETDERADIFAFGAILYEMLSGRRAFPGATPQESLAAILKDEPPALSTLDPAVPAALDRLVRHCLEKRAEERLQSARDLAFWLQSLSEGPSTTSAHGRPPRRRAATMALAGAALFAGAAAAVFGWALFRRPTPAAHFPRRLMLAVLDSAPDHGASFVPFALSPDGRLFVHTRSRGASTPGSAPVTSQLWLRSLGEPDSRPLAGTEAGHEPFFSPDGQWVGFWANGRIKKVSNQGGPAETLCPTKDLWGASWGGDGTIVFSSGEGSGLQRVSDRGGDPEIVTRLATAEGEIAHLWPQVIPGAQAVVFTIRSPKGDRIAVQSLAHGTRTVLIEDGGMARFVPPGHIVFARRSTLYAVPFDAARRSLAGPALPLPGSVFTGDIWGNPWFSVSAEGSIAYVSPWADAGAHSLVWMDRSGSARPILGPRTFAWPRVSPDGKRVAFKDREGSGDVWVLDLAGERLSRLTFDGTESQPAWTPAGDRLAFTVRTASGFALMSQPADGSGPAQLLVRSETRVWPASWAPDGRTLLLNVLGPSGAGDLDSLRLDAQPPTVPFLHGPSNEWGAAVSPDGRSVAYVSDESGRFEVYVQPREDAGSKRQVSTGGGTEPVWSRDGGELFFRNGDTLMSVSLRAGESLRVGKPTPLFRGRSLASLPGLPNYDVAPDGRFLMVMPADQDPGLPAIHIVMDWLEDLERRVPTSFP